MLLNRWLQEDFHFRWIAYFRGETIDRELAELLRRSGCRMAQIGIETANRDALATVKPSADLVRLEAGLQELRSAGVPFGGHFVIGLPGDDESGYSASVALARRQGLAYASFNAFTMRPGSELAESDSGSDPTAMDPSRASSRDGADAVADWIGKAYQSFYLRPGYLWTLLRTVRHPEVFLTLVAMGVSYLRARRRERR
jgi:radical SAM superfamily enzyme YgiQ (UPF0313 family)